MCVCVCVCDLYIFLKKMYTELLRGSLLNEHKDLSKNFKNR